jgi:MFS superfamily sulfate permease-like transporter
MNQQGSTSQSKFYDILLKIFPFIGWFKNYSVDHFKADFISGITVALVLVPQSMAYAQLAGLPAYYGLYAAFLPPMVAALFGSSRQLATGPVAVVSLMTATALEPLATAGSESYIAYAILLALMVGLFQFLLGILRLGVVVNFLSHPVVNGFTNAAALIIATSQLPKLFGVQIDKAEHHYETVWRTIVAAIDDTHMLTLGMAILAFIIMYSIKKWKPRYPNVLIAVIITTLVSWSIGFQNNRTMAIDAIKSPAAVETIETYNQTLRTMDKMTAQRVEYGEEKDEAIEKYGEKSRQALSLEHKITVLNLELKKLKEQASKIKKKIRSFRFIKTGGTADNPDFTLKSRVSGNTEDKNKWEVLVGNKPMDKSSLTFMGGGAVVGVIPQGLPSFEMPLMDMDIILYLLPMAVIISLLGFMEAISIAKAMAAKTGQQLDPNQELIGQGLANILGCMTKSYAVSGSFSRSAVNIQSGAVSGLSSFFTSAFVMITLIFFTPLLYHLPQAVLAAIIMMAVIGLLNIKGFIHAWKAQKYDGAISIITFVTTLGFAPHLDRGIMIGVGLSIILYLIRGMKPQINLLSKHPDGTFRNKDRFGLAQCKYIAVVRYHGSLFFANVNYLEKAILNVMDSMPKLRHIIVVGNGINELDASGEEMISMIVSRVRETGRDISFTGLNDNVLDTLRRTFLYEKIGEDHFFRNVANAVNYLAPVIHESAHETEKECPLTNVVYLSREKLDEEKAI